MIGAEGRAVQQRRHGEFADDDGEGQEGPDSTATSTLGRMIRP
jgi:hypothetical protein